MLVRRLATVARETVGGPREATDGARRWESYGRRTPVGARRTQEGGEPRVVHALGYLHRGCEVWYVRRKLRGREVGR